MISSSDGVEVAAQVVEDLDDLRLDEHVERGRRLVGDDERRPQHQGQRDHQPLAHAAGELVRVGLVAGRRDAHQPQDLERALADLLLGQVGLVLLDGLLEVLGDPHQRVQPGQRLLEDHAELGAAQPVGVLRRSSQDVRALEEHLAVALGALRQQTHQAAAERRLAAAGLPDQPEGLARRQVEADAVDGPDRAAGRAVPDPQVAAPRSPAPVGPLAIGSSIERPSSALLLRVAASRCAAASRPAAVGGCAGSG